MGDSKVVSQEFPGGSSVLLWVTIPQWHACAHAYGLMCVGTHLHKCVHVLIN